MAHLADSDGRMDWDDVAVMLDRVQEACGGPEGMTAVGRLPPSAESSRHARAIGGVPFGPSPIDAVAFAWPGPAPDSHLELDDEEIPGGRLRLSRDRARFQPPPEGHRRQRRAGDDSDPLRNEGARPSREGAVSGAAGGRIDATAPRLRRQAEFKLRPLDRAALDQETAPLSKIPNRRMASLRYDTPSDLPAVEADPGQLRQIVLNLITSASEAPPPERGSIVVRTGAVRADREMGIVRRHQGAIEVIGAPGKGTTFGVLPPASGRRAADPEARPKPPLGRRGRGTVLVVDGEEWVRAVARAILEWAGFTALAAKNGREGAGLYQRHQDVAAAVLLDSTMPVMSGEEAYRRMIAVRPDPPGIFCSGHARQEVAGRRDGSPPVRFLQKPFTPERLLQVVRATMEQPTIEPKGDAADRSSIMAS